MKMCYLAMASLGVALCGAPSTAQPSAAGPAAENERVGLVTILRLRDEFAAEPAAATMQGQHQRSWANLNWPVALPEPFRTRIFTAESYVLLDLDDAGKAAGCRPLRAGTEPVLDTLACTLLMRPGYFSASYVPARESLARRWVMGLRWESLTRAAYDARQADARRAFTALGIGAPARPQAPPIRPAAETPPRARSGSLTATDYSDIADRRIAEDRFEAELTVAGDGVPTGCRVTQSTGNMAVDERTCTLLMARARFAPRDEASGQATYKVHQPVELGWVLHGRRAQP